MWKQIPGGIRQDLDRGTGQDKGKLITELVQ